MAKTRKHRNTAGPLLTKHENTKHEKHVRGLQKGTADAPARVHALPCPSLMPFSHAPLSCPSLTHPSLMPFSLMPLSQKGTADALHSPMPLSHAPLSCHSLMPLSLTHMLSHHAHALSHSRPCSLTTPMLSHHGPRPCSLTTPQLVPMLSHTHALSHTCSHTHAHALSHTLSHTLPLLLQLQDNFPG